MSQFADIFKAVKEDVVPPEKKRPQSQSKSKQSDKVKVSTTRNKTAPEAAASATAAATAAANAAVETPVTKRTGKSSDPEFTQVLTYIRKATHKDVRKALLDDDDRDLSDLVENLLRNWLSNRN